MDLRNYTEDEFREEWARMTDREKSRLKWFIIQMEPSQGGEPKKQSCVYFVEKQGLIKIGRTEKIDQRMTTLRYEFGKDVVLIGTIPAKVVREVVVHKRFAHLRQHGEWFTDCAEIRDYLAEMTK